MQGAKLSARGLGLLFCGVLAFACAKEDVSVEAEEPAKGGCEKDTDCKGERICVRSKCRTPAKAKPDPTTTAAAEARPVPPAPVPTATAAAPASALPLEAPSFIPVASYSPRRGPEHAKVTILEFTDFQCPHCAKLQPALEMVQHTYGEEVSLHIRHFPIPSHTAAEPAARATQAAGRQGKAWEMAELVFANSSHLGDVDLNGYAAKIGLEAARFKADFVSAAVKKEVADDTAAGRAANVRGTPTVFINGKRFTGRRTYDVFKSVVEAELARANGLLAAGTPKSELYAALCRASP